MSKTGITQTPIPTHRSRLMDELQQRRKVESLFALAIDLSIPYPRAHQIVREAEQKDQVTIERHGPGMPLVITWKGG